MRDTAPKNGLDSNAFREETGRYTLSVAPKAALAAIFLVLGIALVTILFMWYSRPAVILAGKELFPTQTYSTLTEVAALKDLSIAFGTITEVSEPYVPDGRVPDFKAIRVNFEEYQGISLSRSDPGASAYFLIPTEDAPALTPGKEYILLLTTVEWGIHFAPLLTSPFDTFWQIVLTPINSTQGILEMDGDRIADTEAARSLQVAGITWDTFWAHFR